MNRLRSAALLAIVTAALGGCAVTPDPSSEPPDSTRPPAPRTVTPTPTPTPTRTPAPTTDAAGVPTTCDALLPDATVAATLGAAWQDTGERIDALAVLPGPTAREAAVGAIASLSCLWRAPSAEEPLVMYAFGLEDDVRADLVEGLLRSADSYASVEVEGAEAFLATETAGALRRTTVYAFVDDVWIVVRAPVFAVVTTSLAEVGVLGARAAAA